LRPFPRPHDFDLVPPPLETAGLAPTFRIYRVAVTFIAAGYADFALIAYHFGKAAVMPGDLNPDRRCNRDGGRRCSRSRAGIAVRPDRVAGDDCRDGNLGGGRTAGFSRRHYGSSLGHGVLGDRHRRPGIGHASDDRPARTPLPPCDSFGLFNAVYGVAWFIGSVLLGILYDRSIAGVAIASTALQAAALPILYWLAHQRTGSSA
jgi:hypothetical protein